MKKNFFFLFVLFSVVCAQSCYGQILGCDRFQTAFTSGYVFKHSDKIFKKVYGRGMGNVLTADLCYFPWECWGIGGKASYWLAVGKTSFFKRHTTLQEIPLTVYVRRMFDFASGLELYGSLGGGGAWISEHSYRGRVRTWRGVGEIEAGLFYPAWCRLDFTSAVRYVFPRQRHSHMKFDVGGFDLRAGIGFSF